MKCPLGLARVLRGTTIIEFAGARSGPQGNQNRAWVPLPLVNVLVCPIISESTSAAKDGTFWEYNAEVGGYKAVRPA